MNTIGDVAELEIRSNEVGPARVSIVIVCYNQARYLPEAIHSALAQTLADVDVVVIDDGSTDNTSDVACSFPAVRCVRQNNQGLAAARNTGIRATTAPYLLFLDADDRLLPEAAESGFDCFQQRPESGFVFGAWRNIFDDGSTAPSEAGPPVDQDHYWHLLQGNIIGMHGAVLYSRQALLQVGGFDTNLAACEDYDLYLRISRHWPVHQHERLIAEYRQHDRNMSRDYAFMLDSALSVLELERERSSHDGRHRLALNHGIRVWQNYYGELLIKEWKKDGRFSALLRILRRYPRGLLDRVVRYAATRIWSRRLEPVSRRFGIDRGQPIDRHYIESFLAEHADRIHGSVLEIGDDAYSRRFGGARITRQDVLHVDGGHPGATVIADLAHAPQIQSERFDCIILTQTLHYIFNLGAAAATLERILKPGGALLLTVPGISQVCRDQTDSESDCWRFTASSVRKLLALHFHTRVHVRAYGNVLAASSFLYGKAAHELSRRELDHQDRDYPVIIAAVAVKE